MAEMTDEHHDVEFKSDRLVYALCRLTDEEIAVVEGENGKGKNRNRKHS